MSAALLRSKRFLHVGAVLGGLASIAIALLMDVQYADSLGTWRNVIAKDLGRLFSASFTPDDGLVYLTFGLVLLFLAAIGALMGIFFALIVYRFLRLLGGDRS